MDSKQLYQYYLAEANRRGYKMKWYEALVSFFLIFWIVIGVLKLFSGYGELGREYYTSGIPSYEGFLSLLFIIEVVFSIAPLVILFLLRMEMRKFSSKVITYLWIYLFLGLVGLIILTSATAIYIGSLSLVLKLLIFDPAVMVALLGKTIILGLHAIYFYKRRHLFGNIPPPEGVSPIYYQSSQPQSPQLQSPQTQNTQLLYYPQQQSPPTSMSPPSAKSNEAENDLKKMEAPQEEAAEINTDDTAQDQEKQKKIDQALAFLLKDEESLPDYLKNTEKE